MQTLKLKYQSYDIEFYDILKTYMSQSSICLRYLYNRLDDAKGQLLEKDLRNMSSSIQGIDSLDCWFVQSQVKNAISLYKSFQSRVKEHEETREQKLKDLEFKHAKKNIFDHKYALKRKWIMNPLKLIFGGKDNFQQRLKNQISKEQFKLNRLSPLYSIGEAQFKGNRKFNIDSELNILFKPNAKQHYTLKLSYGKNQERILRKLFELTLNKSISISYKLDLNYIYISFDETKLETIEQIKYVQNRVLGIDMNPNYIGWSIVDWKSSSEFEVVESGVYSFKQLSDMYKELNSLKDVSSDDPRRIYLNNKRTYETVKVAENIVAKAVYYKCQTISIEDLNIPAKDRNKGKNYNALCNNHWLRTELKWQLQKRTRKYGIKLLEVKPQYSSFIGNFLFRSLQLPDMVLSSIEIGRRGYEYLNQYILKTTEIQKNIIQPNTNDFKEFWRMSIEELIPEFDGVYLVDLYNFIKSKKDHHLFKGDPNKVRIQLNQQLVKRFFSIHSNIYI